MKTRFIRDAVFVLGVVCLLGTVPAFAGKAEAVPSYMPLFSDLNGDNQVDQVTLRSDGLHKQIHITLGKSTSQSLHFDTEVSERGHLYYGDFDNDGDIDLLWSSQTYPRSIVMWEGDGRGNFSLSNADEAAHPFKSVSYEDSPSRISEDPDGLGLACTISSFFFGSPAQALVRIRLTSSEKMSSPEPPSFCDAVSLSISTERGPPQLLF